jgi:hypothetical protein
MKKATKNGKKLMCEICDVSHKRHENIYIMKKLCERGEKAGNVAGGRWSAPAVMTGAWGGAG